MVTASSHWHTGLLGGKKPRRGPWRHPGGDKVLGGLGFFASAFRLVRVGLLVGLVVSGFIDLIIDYDLSNHIDPLWK